MAIRLTGALVLSVLAVGVPVAAGSSSPAKPVKITVTLREYSIALSKTHVPKGTTVIFTVKNAGSIQHNVDFVGLGKRTAVAGAGSKLTLKITFKKRGAIQVVCDVPRHIQLGMITSFRVT